MKRKIKLVIFMTLTALSVAYAAFSATKTMVELRGEESPQSGLSLDDCVKYSVYNSFEAKLAKLDLLIAETQRLYSEAVFDTILFGEINYAEDKRQQLSVFSGDNRQTNLYSIGVQKELPTGTEIKATWSDQRDWVNSSFVTNNPAHNAQLTFEGSQPLLKNAFGFIDRNTVTVTKLAIMNSGLQMRQRIDALIAEVEKGYWNMVAMKLVLDITEDMLEKANTLYDANLRNFDMGIIEKVDLYASEANVRIREKDVMLAENEYKRAQDNLKLLMNISEEYALSPGDKFSLIAEEFDLGECLKIAFEKSQTYQIRKRDVEINDITLKMKGNAMWPELDLKGTFAMNGLEQKFDKAAGKTTVADNTYYYAGIKLTMPIENSQARSEFQKASYEKERAIVSLKEEERTIITSVGNSFRTLKTLNSTVVNMNEASRLQSEKLKEEEKRYQYGRSNTKRLIDYQSDLLSARMAEAKELLAREIARVDLEKEMSVLFEKYEDIL
jgi:outer membrane protein